jgi:hypothetical protein
VPNFAVMSERARKVRRIESPAPRRCRPTLRGLTTGTVRVTSVDDLEPVILWGDGFCSWLGVLHELKFRPVAVLLTDPAQNLDIVRACVGADCFIGSVASLTDAIILSLKGSCRLGLIDGRVSSGTCDLARKLDLKGLLGTQRMRRGVGGWSTDICRISHCD